jgi:hypothetical protein
MISPVAMPDCPSSVSACGGPATLLGHTGGREKFPNGSLFHFATRQDVKACSKPAAKMVFERLFRYTETTDSEQRSYPI